MISNVSFILILSVFAGYNGYAQSAVDIPGVDSFKVITSDQYGAPILDLDDEFGSAVSRIGDLNNDGIEDIAVGAKSDDDTTSGNTGNKGAVYICFMTSSFTIGSYYKISAVDTVFNGEIDDLDAFGVSVAGLGDLNGDGHEDIVVGAHGDDDQQSNSGAVYILFLDSTGVVQSHKKISNNHSGMGSNVISVSGGFGFSVCALGDIDDDGVMDIGVGAYNDITATLRFGSFWTIRLNSDGTVKGYKKISEGLAGFGGDFDNTDGFGGGCSGAGDLNGDGVEDAIVAAYLDDDGGTNAGALWILYLETDGEVADEKKLSLPLHSKTYDYYTDYRLGARSVLAYDFGGDGVMDVIAGSATNETVFTIGLDSLQNVMGVRRIGNLNSSCEIASTNTSNFGACGITGIDDLNGDGKPEILIGAQDHRIGADYYGGVYVMHFEESEPGLKYGEVFNTSKIGDISGGFSATFANSDNFGISVCVLGDVNGDGIDDIAVGSNRNDQGGTDRGAVYVLFLDSLSNVGSYQKIAHATGGFSKTLINSDYFGFAVCAPGDLDGDGVPDLIVGAPQDDDGGTNRGAFYIIYLDTLGQSKGSEIKVSDLSGGFNGTLANSDLFGCSIANIGDINGDGINDLAVGSYGSDDGATDNGSIWILRMKADETVANHQEISDTQGSFSETFTTGARFGVSLSEIGNFFADTIPDVVVGADKMNGEGAVYILNIDTVGVVTDYEKIGTSNSNWTDTLQNGGNFGRGVTACADLDSNGVRDLLIGQNLCSTYGTAKGGAYVAFLDSTAHVISAQKIAEDAGGFYGNLNNSDAFGTAVCYLHQDYYGNPRFFISAVNQDEGGTDRGSLYSMNAMTVTVAESFSKLNVKNDFATLRRKLDGHHYLTPFNMLFFKYKGEYNNGALKFNIYNDNHVVVATETTNPAALYNFITNTTAASPATGNLVYGDNRFRLDISCNGLMLHLGTYILEVINEKNEKFYLRFKRSYGFNCGPWH